MNIVDKFARTIKALEKAINPTIKKTVEQNKSLIIDQQTDGQMNKGKDSNDAFFVPSYADSTKSYKRSKGQPTNRVTLKDTGDLYNSINVEAKVNEMIISANVAYFKYLVTHYDKNQILGLNRKFKHDFIENKIKPNLEKSWGVIIKRN